MARVLLSAHQTPFFFRHKQKTAMSSSHHNIQGRWDTALAREWGWNQWTPPSRPSPRETLLQACTLSLPALCCCLVAKSHLTLCNPMDCSKPGFPVLHCLPEFAQTHVHWVSDAIQPSHPLLSSLYPPAPNVSQHQGLFQWVISSYQVDKVLELQHQSFQWIVRLEFL